MAGTGNEDEALRLVRPFEEGPTQRGRDDLILGGMDEEDGTVNPLHGIPRIEPVAQEQTGRKKRVVRTGNVGQGVIGVLNGFMLGS